VQRRTLSDVALAAVVAWVAWVAMLLGQAQWQVTMIERMAPGNW
jgi:hypothetical protein